MENITSLSFQTITQPSRWAELRKDIKNFTLWNDTKHAFQYARALDSKIKNARDVPADYLRAVARLKWIAFSLLNEQEALKLIENYIYVPLDADIDIIEKLKQFLLFLPFDEQEEIKKKISRILEESEYEISQQRIQLQGGDEVHPSIKNWLTDYRIRVTSKESDEMSLARFEYFAHNRNFSRLEDGDKNKLKKIFEFYDFVNTSGLLAGSYVDDLIIRWEDGSISIVDDGDIYRVHEGSGRPVPRPAAEVGTVGGEYQNIMGVYAGDKEGQRQVQESEEALLRDVGSDNQKLIAAFYASVKEKNANETIAALHLMAQRQQIEALLRDDGQLKKFLAATWKERHGESVAQEFLDSPEAQQFVRLFLEYVLEERLGFLEGDAARVGAQIGNIYKRIGKPEYGKMAYFDMEDDAFHWLKE